MGYNTVVVLYNDQIDRMTHDDLVGLRISKAVNNWSLRDRNPVSTWFGYGEVVSQAHADYSQVVVCGQNSGKPICECDNLDYYALAQIADALRRHGYTVKLPKNMRKEKDD